MIGVVVWSCSTDKSATAPKPKEVYVVNLDGASERPTPRVTAATGVAVVEVLDDNTITYAVTATGLVGAIAGHFHVGDPTVAGAIMYGIYNNAAGTDFGGSQVAAGTITRTGGGFSGAFTFDSLLTNIRAGTAYVNLHTKTYPGGEIRGQIVK